MSSQPPVDHNTDYYHQQRYDDYYHPDRTDAQSVLSSAAPTTPKAATNVPLEDPFTDDPNYHIRAQEIAKHYPGSPERPIRVASPDSNSTVTLTEQQPHSIYGDTHQSDLNSSSTHLHRPTFQDDQSYMDDPYRKTGTSSPGPHDFTAKTSSPSGRHGYEDMEYGEPYGMNTTATPQKDSSFITLLFGGGGTSKYPLAQKIEAKRHGTMVRQMRPYVTYVLTTVMVAVFIYELVVNWKAQGTPFSFKPYINPLLGPSQSALISVGARFPPCMKFVEDVPPTMLIGCLNNTALPPTNICTIGDICGFGGVQNNAPNQSFRFFTAIFLHGGIVHILLNMFVQMTLSAQVEKEMGSIGFAILYFSAGIFGNILGGNFAMVGVPSIGASGAIFGTVSVMWVDLLAHWQFEHRPWKKLFMLFIELAIGVAIGFIPGIDNFAHLGGFLAGLLAGVSLYPIISETKLHTNIVWAFRLLGLILTIILFVTLTRNFYTSDPYKACSWCRYLSCIPTAANNRCTGTGITTTTTTST